MTAGEFGEWVKQQPTWLDLAAMHAMQGLLAGGYRIDGDERKRMITQMSYKLAEAMLDGKRRREAP